MGGGGNIDLNQVFKKKIKKNNNNINLEEKHNYFIYFAKLNFMTPKGSGLLRHTIFFILLLLLFYFIYLFIIKT